MSRVSRVLVVVAVGLLWVLAQASAAVALGDSDGDGTSEFSVNGAVTIGSSYGELEQAFSNTRAELVEACGEGWWFYTDGVTGTLSGPPDDLATTVTSLFSGQPEAC